MAGLGFLDFIKQKTRSLLGTREVTVQASTVQDQPQQPQPVQPAQIPQQPTPTTLNTPQRPGVKSNVSDLIANALPFSQYKNIRQQYRQFFSGNKSTLGQPFTAVQSQGSGQELVTFSDEEIERIGFAESSGDVSAVSVVGATGKYQILKDTWNEINEIRARRGQVQHPYSDATNPKVSKEYAKIYLNDRIPEILKIGLPEIPVSKTTILLYYGGGRPWIRDWQKGHLTQTAQTYLANAGL